MRVVTIAHVCVCVCVCVCACVCVCMRAHAPCMHVFLRVYQWQLYGKFQNAQQELEDLESGFAADRLDLMQTMEALTRDIRLK